MSKISLPSEYHPYEKVWVCGNYFNNGFVLFEIEKNPVFLIGNGNKDSKVWLNFPKSVGGKPKWVKAIENNKLIEPGFQISTSQYSNEVSYNEIPIIQYQAQNSELKITLINLTTIGLNIVGGINSLKFSGNTLQNNTFNNVHTMVGIGS